MKVKVYSLIHAEVGIVAQVVTSENADIDLEQEFKARMGDDVELDLEADDDYKVDIWVHEVIG